MNHRIAERACEECGFTYQPKTFRQRFCCPDCSVRQKQRLLIKPTNIELLQEAGYARLASILNGTRPLNAIQAGGSQVCGICSSKDCRRLHIYTGSTL